MLYDMDNPPLPLFNLSALEAKTGLARAKLPEPFLVSLYRCLAPYRGCCHGCVYCDGRAEKYYVEGVFDRDIAVREKLCERVASDVASGFAAREYGALCLGSGVTDVYQKVERELELTRRTLKKIAETGLPIVILTKSDLILRDFDILSRFPKTLIILTITTVDEADAARLEPGAPSPVRRLQVIREAKKRGFFSGIMAMPLCPGISDSDASFTALLDAAVAVGADFVYPGGLTLRPGRQKDSFFALIDTHYPALKADYEHLYRENRPSGSPLASRSAALTRRVAALLHVRALPPLIPHRVYRELLSPPDSLFVLLCHMHGLYAQRGVDIRALKAATDRYAARLAKERTALRRKRLAVEAAAGAFPLTRRLTERMEELIASLANPRLESLATELQKPGRYFDYTSLQIKLDAAFGKEGRPSATIPGVP